VSVTYLTPPTDHAQLVAFYEKARPAGAGWRRIRASSAVQPSPDSVPQMLLGWVLGCLFVYSALFGAGGFVFGRPTLGIAWTAVFVVTGLGLLRLLPRMWSAGG
jgi:hypothetical protein